MFSSSSSVTSGSGVEVSPSGLEGETPKPSVEMAMNTLIRVTHWKIGNPRVYWSLPKPEKVGGLCACWTKPREPPPCGPRPCPPPPCLPLE